MSIGMRRILAVALIGAFTQIAGTAWAHPTPEAYGPDDGATISSPPSEVWVDMNEGFSSGQLYVYDPCGDRVDDGSPEEDPILYKLTVGTSSNKAGTYTAVWTVLGDDGHKTSGDWNFTVTDGSSCPAAEPGPDDDTDTNNEQPDDGDDADEGDVSAAGGSNDDNADDPAAAFGGKGGNNKSNKGEGKHHNHKPKPEVADPAPDAGSTGPTTADTAPIAGDIPVDWLLISFGIAALIGAAAGQIYVNLVGPEAQTKPRRNN